MICQDPQRPTRGHRYLNSSVSMTKRFRIQVQDAETEGWRMYADFRFQGEAEACLDALQQRGIEARVLPADLTPTSL